MDKRIIPSDVVLSANQLQFSLEKPIKAYYQGVCKPIFLIPPCEYKLNATRQYASLRLIKANNGVWDFLSNLDLIIPKTAWEQRKKWFPEDLHENTLEEFTEAYRRNLSPPDKSGQSTFNIFLGELREGNELPVPVFKVPNNTSDPNPAGKDTVKPEDSVKPSAPKLLSNALQELAWGSTQGKVSILVECSGLWTKEESFGMSWRIRQIVYRASPSLPKGSLSFLDNDSMKQHKWTVAPPPNALLETNTDEGAVTVPDTAAATISESDSHVNPLLDHDD